MQQTFGIVVLTLLVVSVICPVTSTTNDVATDDDLVSRPCRVRQMSVADKHHIVCECTKDYCDNLVFEWPKKQSNVLLHVQSSKSGKRFEQIQHAIASSPVNKNPDYTIMVNVNEKFQEILGWGGAFTDGTVINWSLLNNSLDESVLESYFGETGLQYSIGRIPISGSDFSTRAYTYDDTEDNEPDLELKHWHLAREDINLKIPYIKRARTITKSRPTEADLKLFGSTWSPPAWMKTSHTLVRGHLKGDPVNNSTMFRVYAKYLVKFLEAYEESGVKLWGMTLQNEPYSAMLPVYFFNSLIMNSSEQNEFLKNHLGPLLIEKGYTKDRLKLIVGDDSLIFVNHAVEKIMADSETKKYVSGIGIHWYFSNRYTYHYTDDLYRKYKDDVEFLLSTEACTGFTPVWKRRTDPGAWVRGADYAYDIIENLRRNVNGWIDWNMAVNMTGGPNWSGNEVDSPILVDLGNDRFLKNPMYYALGHFTRFMGPGSRRISATSTTRKQSFFNILHLLHDLMLTAVLTPTNHVSIVVLNRHDRLVTVRLDLGANKSVSLTIEPESISTFVYSL